MADIELAQEFASRALAAFDVGAVGQYGPYTVEIGKHRVLRRGPIIDMSWPVGKRVEIIGPDVTGDARYKDRRGWAWHNLGEGAVRVVPDGCGWPQRDGLYYADSIKEVA